MRRLDAAAYDEVRAWMYRNARPLELALWQFCFEGKGREGVLDALGFYQNEDGGFGNTVEPDSWNPSSSPYSTLTVVTMLWKMGPMDQGNAVIDGMLGYLESGADASEEGWHFTIPSNDSYPRAPWHTYDEAVNRVQDMGITAGLCAFALHYGAVRPALQNRVLGYVERIMDKVKGTEDFGEMGASGLGMLIEELEAKGLAGRFGCQPIKEMLPGLVDRTIERNPDKWSSYTPRPSAFIWSPQCPFYPGNEDVVELELDYLIDTRNPKGVWDITWTWFGLGDKYPKEFAISENWWKASKAIEKISFLKAFGRIGH